MTTLTLLPSDLADLVLPTPRQLKRLGAEQVRTNSWRGYLHIMPKV